MGIDVYGIFSFLAMGALLLITDPRVIDRYINPLPEKKKRSAAQQGKHTS
jgi:hypothetical protein